MVVIYHRSVTYLYAETKSYPVPSDNALVIKILPTEEVIQLTTLLLGGSTSAGNKSIAATRVDFLPSEDNL